MRIGASTAGRAGRAACLRNKLHKSEEASYMVYQPHMVYQPLLVDSTFGQAASYESVFEE